MIQISDIRKLHLELSSFCNARCPLCPRNFNGYPYNRGYEETNLTLEKLKTIVSVDFLQQIDEILINGNFGDFVMNPESVEIIDWLKTVNGKTFIHVSTNGGARDRKFWQALAKLGIEINFCIDGLEDTHHLYRQDTTYEQVVRNAVTYITAGGRANWVMTRFDHNQHQFDEARSRANQLKFSNFIVRETVRNTGSVYDRQGKRIFTMRNNNNFPAQLTDTFIQKQLKVDNMIGLHSNKGLAIACESAAERSLYIGADGKIDACCYLSGNLFSDIAEYKKVNTNTVEQGIQWFNQILEKNTTDPLSMCRLMCGSKND